MSGQATMTMAGMGGPVGGAFNVNAATSSDTADYGKRLNTYIYDYFVRNQHYECARIMLSSQESLPLLLHTKSSPNQRQANGADDVDMDAKHIDRPKDLPLPDLPAGNGDFLEDWWMQFWDVYHSRRSGNGKTSTLAYISYQRQLQKQRNGADASASRNFSMMNGGPGADLKKAAMINNGNMNPQMQQAMRARAQNGGMAAGQMERQGSQMDGSPGSGGAPSPKRARVDGNMQQMGQQRPGQAGQMPNQSLEQYNVQMQQQMKHAINQAQSGSNIVKGMPNSTAAAAAALQAGAQGSPMPQAGQMELMEMANGMQRGMMQPGISMNAAGGQPVNNNGSHALQDYQMQLMLLEQQNKRRLMMARGEQENLTGHTGVPAQNGHFAPNMSPSGRGGPSPNPNDMARGTPKMNNGPSPNGMTGRGSPGPGFDPNVMNAQMRAGQLMIGPNGQMIPRSNPMQPNQLEMLRAQQMMQSGGFPGGMPPNMMQGQAGVPPNMTPRQSSQMPPPPAPQANTTGTQPSSPAPAAPPTPNQNAKSKAGKKNEAKGNKNSNKKGASATAATPASEAEQPPTPTPQTPLTSAKAFTQNQVTPMTNGMQNGAINGAPGMQLGVMQNQQDMPFIEDPTTQFITDFPNLDNSHGDVLDNFDFDAFLQNTGEDGAMGGGFGYDDFPLGGIETGDGLGQ